MNNINIIGLDIGGANTKAALIIFKNFKILKTFSYIEYFPFWEKNVKQIPKMLQGIISNIVIMNGYEIENINYVAITITAELSDAFQTKREGIMTILAALERVFKKEKMRFINIDGNFVNIENAKLNYHMIAAVNWVSTALFLGQYEPDCILIDGGSTTIDIIPIQYSIPIAKGKDDISRLMHHELIYTGGLRATIPSISHFVPYKEMMVRISFEKFALISDVHRILKNISEEEYINDTADNRSTSLEDCYARLSRIICMDLESISKVELDKIAKYLYNKQLDIIKFEIKKFYDELIERIPEFRINPLFIITGLSSDFLIRRALELIGFENVKYYESMTNIPDKVSSSAFAVAGALYFQLKEKDPNVT